MQMKSPERCFINIKKNSFATLFSLNSVAIGPVAWDFELEEPGLLQSILPFG